MNHFWVQDSKLFLGFCDNVTKTAVFFTGNNNNFDELAQLVKNIKYEFTMRKQYKVTKLIQNLPSQIYQFSLFLKAQMVERSTVNRKVIGSNPI